jgi:hypothetical protein
LLEHTTICLTRVHGHLYQQSDIEPNKSGFQTTAIVFWPITAATESKRPANSNKK